MADRQKLLPVSTLRTQMDALATLGLNVQRVRSRVGLLPEGPNAMVTVKKYEAMWSEAQSLYGMPGLPTALAMAIPFGAFGALDYLVASAATVAGCCESAVMHFAMAASDVWLELDAVD